MPSLALTPASHIRSITPLNLDQRTEDRMEVEALLRFVGKSMTCHEIAKANDTHLSRARRALDDMAADGVLLTQMNGGRIEYTIRE